MSFLSFIGCGSNPQTFDWLATESAPSRYPMEIIHGTFVYHGEKNNGLYIPSRGTLTKAWGSAISTHVVGPSLKPLPDRLEITFMSLAENQFYRGEFDLPYEKILELFRDGVSANKERPTYRKLMVGVAPGGVVAVWAYGRRTKEVFFGQAEKIDMDPKQAFGIPFNTITPDEFVRGNLVDALSAEDLESLTKNGIPFGLWSRYRNRYQWTSVFTPGHTPSKFGVRFLNGENISDVVLDQQTDNGLMLVPQQVGFHAAVAGKKYIYYVHFDDYEILEAFEKLGSEGQMVYIEFDPRVPRPKTQVRIYNEDESITLEKVMIEDW